MSSGENSRSGIIDRGGDDSYKAPRLNCTISDFDLLRRAGDGSFSTVVKSRFHTDGEIYALKIVDKHFVVRHKYLSRILLERNVLDKIHYDGIVQLKFTFQDADHLCTSFHVICNPSSSCFGQISPWSTFMEGSYSLKSTKY